MNNKEAILLFIGVLIGFYVGMSWTTSNYFSWNDGSTRIEQNLQNAVQYRGSTFTSSTAEFQRGAIFRGTIYTSDSFIEIIGGEGTIDFECSPDLGEICQGGDTLTINGDFRAIIKACCESGSPPICHVGIGEVQISC